LKPEAAKRIAGVVSVVRRIEAGYEETIEFASENIEKRFRKK
jgi:hypothetical protein